MICFWAEKCNHTWSILVIIICDWLPFQETVNSIKKNSITFLIRQLQKMGCTEFTARNIAGVIGALLLSFASGAPWHWGLICSYITSSYKLSQPHLTLEYASIVLPVSMVCASISFTFGGYLTSRIGVFWLVLTSQVAGAICIYCSTFAVTFDGFTAVYAGLQGFCIGLAVEQPIQHLKIYFKGRYSQWIAATALIGVAFNPILYGQVFRWYVNPDNSQPTNGYFLEKSIIDQVTSSIRYMSFLSGILGVSGSFLMLPIFKFNKSKKLTFQQWIQKNKQSQKGETVDQHFIHSEREVYMKAIQLVAQKTEKPANGQTQQPERLEQQHVADPTLLSKTVFVNIPSHTIVRSKLFWGTGLFIVLLTLGNMIIINHYRLYVLNTISNDKYFITVGCLAFVSFATSRFIVQFMSSKVRFRSVSRFLTIANMLIFTAIKFTVDLEDAYAIIVIVSAGVLSGAYTASSHHFRQSFGNVSLTSKLKISPDIFFAVAAILEYILINYNKKISMIDLFWVCLGACILLIPFILIYQFKYEAPELSTDNKIENASQAPIQTPPQAPIKASVAAMPCSHCRCSQIFDKPALSGISQKFTTDLKSSRRVVPSLSKQSETATLNPSTIISLNSSDINHQLRVQSRAMRMLLVMQRQISAPEKTS